MKKRNKYSLFIIIFISILGICTYRYHEINKDAPTQYLIDKYDIGELIQLDSMSVKVNSFKIEQMEVYGKQNYNLSVDATIKNTSDEVLDGREIIQESKVSLGILSQDYCEASGDVKNMSKLNAGEERNITLSYILNKELISKLQIKDEYRFYIGKVLFKNQIEEKANKLHLYGKYVKLGEYNNE